MPNEPIDLVQQFAAVSGQEDMLGFCELSLARSDGPPVSGLCRFSKPKPGSAQIRYLSISLLMDTPDAAAHTAVDAMCDRLAEAVKTIPVVQDVVSVPAMTDAPESAVRQLDVMLEDQVDPGEVFITERLLPALRRVATVGAEGVTWWTEDPSATPDGAEPPAGEPASLLDRVRRYLR